MTKSSDSCYFAAAAVCAVVSCAASASPLSTSVLVSAQEFCRFADCQQTANLGHADQLSSSMCKPESEHVSSDDNNTVTVFATASVATLPNQISMYDSGIGSSAQSTPEKPTFEKPTPEMFSGPLAAAKTLQAASVSQNLNPPFSPHLTGLLCALRAGRTASEQMGDLSPRGRNEAPFPTTATGEGDSSVSVFPSQTIENTRGSVKSCLETCEKIEEIVGKMLSVGVKPSKNTPPCIEAKMDGVCSIHKSLPRSNNGPQNLRRPLSTLNPFSQNSPSSEVSVESLYSVSENSRDKIVDSKVEGSGMCGDSGGSLKTSFDPSNGTEGKGHHPLRNPSSLLLRLTIRKSAGSRKVPEEKERAQFSKGGQPSPQFSNVRWSTDLQQVRYFDSVDSAASQKPKSISNGRPVPNVAHYDENPSAKRVLQKTQTSQSTSGAGSVLQKTQAAPRTAVSSSTRTKSPNSVNTQRHASVDNNSYSHKATRRSTSNTSHHFSSSAVSSRKASLDFRPPWEPSTKIAYEKPVPLYRSAKTALSNRRQSNGSRKASLDCRPPWEPSTRMAYEKPVPLYRSTVHYLKSLTGNMGQLSNLGSLASSCGSDSKAKSRKGVLKPAKATADKILGNSRMEKKKNGRQHVSSACHFFRKQR